MKIRTKPQTYDAIQFNSIDDKLIGFLNGTGVEVLKVGRDFIMSGYVGNQGLNIGDWLYKHNEPLTFVSIVHGGNQFDKYFEVVDE